MKAEGNWRYQFVGWAFGLGALLIIGGTIRLHFLPEADDLLEEGEFYSGSSIEVFPPRGQIYDRYGRLLAGNHTVYELGLNFKNINDPRSIAVAMNGIFGYDFAEMLQTASRDKEEMGNQYWVLEAAVQADKANIILDYKEQQRLAEANGETVENSLDGLDLRPYLQRSYPEDTLASNLLGFVSSEGQGYFGVEQYYQNLLAGKVQDLWFPTNPNDVTNLPDIPPGANLVLTIDRELQVFVEQTLDKAIEKYEAKAGTVIVMNPENGEILALASTPRLNLNEYWRYYEMYPDNSVPFNRAISKSFEPGSVFKVLTMAAALDNGTVELDTEFLDVGYHKMGGITIRNWDQQAWGEQDMTGCMRHSLNVCLAWIGEEMGAADFYRYMDAFGFGHFTGVDIAGEATGRVKAPGDEDWWPADLGTNTFGQGISVTPIQLMMAVSAIANEGRMVVPHVLHSFVEGGNQYDIQPQLGGQPITAETAQILTEMLSISLEVEGSQALVPGYTISGKTGTAEIPGDEGYSRERTHASFIGWGPSEDPKFIVYVWLEEPGTSIWGSTTAAPVFSEIAQRLVISLNIPPDSVRAMLNGQ